MMTGPRARTLGTLALNVFAGIALLVGSSWFFHTWFGLRTEEQAPRVVNSITLEPTILLAGKPFYAHVNVTINRLCPYEVHWSLVERTSNVEAVKIIEQIKPAMTLLGTQDIPPVARWVPSSVGAGDYRYMVEVYDICGEGHTYVSVRRSADVTIR